MIRFPWCVTGSFVAGVALSMLGCDPGVYVCVSHEQCDGVGVSGRCESAGYCSFGADDCASGRRFGIAAPDDFAGRCVPPQRVPSTSPPPDLEPGQCECPREDASCPTSCDPGPGPDGEPGDTGDEPCADEGMAAPAVIDLLLVLDDTDSFADARELFLQDVPHLAHQLTGPDGFRDLHVGVVGSDVGDAGGGLGGESCGAFGNEGRLASTYACGGDGLFLDHDVTRDPEILGNALGCVIQRAPADACSLEQPLESGLRALADSSLPLVFPGVDPQGDDANAGFLREDSLLVVVMLTDEDDCSIEDPAPFASPTHAETACVGAGTWPIERYVDGLRALRPDPSKLLFVAIAGVPADLVHGLATDYDAVLADPRMQNIIVNDFPNPLPTCSSELVTAEPARRLTKVARGLSAGGVATTVQSVCSMDPRTWTASIAAAIDDVVGHATAGC